MTIRVYNTEFETMDDATDFVRECCSPAGDPDVSAPNDLNECDWTETYRSARGVPVMVRWTFTLDDINTLIPENLPWDNGTARLVVDGCHVEEVD